MLLLAPGPVPISPELAAIAHVTHPPYFRGDAFAKLMLEQKPPPPPPPKVKEPEPEPIKDPVKDPEPEKVVEREPERTDPEIRGETAVIFRMHRDMFWIF